MLQYDFFVSVFDCCSECICEEEEVERGIEMKCTLQHTSTHCNTQEYLDEEVEEVNF